MKISIITMILMLAIIRTPANLYALPDSPKLPIPKVNVLSNIDIVKFKPDAKRNRPLEHAWAICSSVGNTCLVVIWIRGTQEDIRIKISGSVKNETCHVEIPSSLFDQYFKYAVLCGIKQNGKGNINAQFGGGSAGGRNKYWFTWSSNVTPSFYCVIR